MNSQKNYLQKSIIEEGIGYKGSVRIGYQDKNGKIIRIEKHNEGKLPLFTCLCRALAGYDITKQRPQFIMCYDADPSDPEKYIKILTSKVISNAPPLLYQANPQTGVPEQNSQECNIAEYVFTIPVTALAKLTGGITIKKLALLNSQDEECATIELLEPNWITIDSAINTTNILIYWKLEFFAYGAQE